MFFVELCFEIFLSADEEKLQLWQRDRNPLRQRQRRDHQDQVQLSHCPPGEGEDAAEPGSEEVRIASPAWPVLLQNKSLGKTARHYMNVFGPFHMQTRSREDSAERNFFLEGEFTELFLYCLGLNFTHLSCSVFHFKNFYNFQICWRCSSGHWLHAVRPH